MALHLVVAYETASSPELSAALLERSTIEREASFTMLVPATPRHHLLTYLRGRDIETAERMAMSARLQLEASGLKVRNAVVGPADPIKAIAQELAGDQTYESIIICTHPSDVSRWLRARVPARAKDFGLPVTHVVVKSVAESLGQSRAGVLRPPFG